jgi:SAM-dependent methyltransferase
MRKSDIPKISVNDIMERIRREVEGRKKPSPKETPQEVLHLASHPSSAETDQPGLSLDDFLWKYGTKYAKMINKIPILKNIAKKQYWRLAPIKRYQSSFINPPRTNHMDLDFLGTNWYYHDFFEQTKKEGLKGSIKRFILKYVGFHAWWQGQINKAIYQELTRQRADLTEREKISEDLHAKTTMELRQEISEMSRQIRDQKGEDLFYGTMYLAFQDKFRGTRVEIKERMTVYLPYIHEAGAGSVEGPILDLGCGRGEWLELCKDNHLVAKGVDINPAMAGQCLKFGFHAIGGDAVAALKTQVANRFGAITGFHLIEHLPFSSLISLFDETLRVLKPGGIVIFETPNPENVLVGSCNFYTDPTHRTPLVPELVRFIGDQRGFVKTSILRLHKRKEPQYTGDEFVDELIYRFNLEQDYAFIGYKP